MFDKESFSMQEENKKNTQRDAGGDFYIYTGGQRTYEDGSENGPQDDCPSGQASECFTGIGSLCRRVDALLFS